MIYFRKCYSYSLFRSFMVSCLTFKSLSHFDFIFVHSVRVSLALLIYSFASFVQNTYWRDCLFHILYSCLLYWRLIDCRCVGLFLASLFLPLICIYFVHYHTCDYCSFVILSEVWESYTSCFPFFPKNCFGSSGIL